MFTKCVNNFLSSNPTTLNLSALDDESKYEKKKMGLGGGGRGGGGEALNPKQNARKRYKKQQPSTQCRACVRSIFQNTCFLKYKPPNSNFEFSSD